MPDEAKEVKRLKTLTEKLCEVGGAAHFVAAPEKTQCPVTGSLCVSSTFRSSAGRGLV